ncbi:MAG: L,D-transpeptidase, partial [Eubacteriales bacterium]|nr:L,D-transpeptidase [Eubacteriales bacterium]
MRKKFNISLFLISFFCLFSFLYFKENFVFAEDIDIIPSPVFAEINDDCNVFFDMEMKNYIKKLKKGASVEILQDKGEKVYLIKSEEEKIKGWVLAEFLNIPETPLANENRLKDIEIEKYINENGFDSKTDYFVFTDIYRQLTYILKGKINNWKMEKTIICATGKNTSPTTRGFFEIGDKGEWFYSERLGSGAKYWVRFNGSYLFHSVAMDKNKNIQDNTIGQRCSSGCVRMQIEDIKWFYENIPYG